MPKFGIRLALGLAASMVFASSTLADTIYDNWNEAACLGTSQASVSLPRPARIDSIKLWYSWAANQTKVRYSLGNNGRQLATGWLVRGNCHPSMPSWCDANANVNLVVDAGVLDVVVRGDYVCANSVSSNNGFIKLFGAEQ